MYSRKNSGYAPTVPPPGYNGVTFNRDYQPSSSVPARKEEPVDPAEDDMREDAIAEDGGQNDCQEIEAHDTHEEREAPDDRTEAEGEPDVLRDIASKELRIEDLLTIGAVLLFVSGELDGDIMLLLGLLLVAGI